MVEAEVMETFMDGCVRWSLRKNHVAELRTTHHRFHLLVIASQR